MSDYILVHGAWHGGWCWDKVVPLLERRGHTVLAPDLPALGYDTTPLETVTLQSFRDAIVKIVDDRAEPVILVGHSRAGLVISEVAEARPEKVRRLVYLTAFLLRDGETLMQRAQTDRETVLNPHFVPSADGRSISIADEGLVPSFYADCSAEDIARARSLLRPEPTAVLVTPVALSAENYGRVPRTYIECLRDGAIGIETQRSMYAASPCERVETLDTSHSPFLSAPVELAALLDAISNA